MTKKSQPTNRSRTPSSEKFMEFVGSNWGEFDALELTRWPVADFTKARRETIASEFPGKVLIFEASEPRVRSNDSDYRYRPDSAFVYFTGWGSQSVPGSALVIDARGQVPESTLYLRPTAGKNSDEFFANPAIGEFWVGQRPSLGQIETQLGIKTRDIAEFETDAKSWEAILDKDSEDLMQKASEIRFIKDDHEIAELKKAVAVTVSGFAEVARAIPRATRQPRGERVVETAFFSVARQHAYDLGYDTIAASGKNACILHWTRNDGDVKSGDLILVDAGAEVDSLYTADVTRTIPVSGKFSKEQLFVYEAVLEAADAAFAAVKPGALFRDVHNAAIAVIAQKVSELGLIPVTPEEALDPENQHHRRYMVHGTSHHLGLDVHDCAKARREMYQDGVLEPGMVFTIEPGLYFHENDLLVPEAYRGIGVRIEDDVLVTETGYENLSAGLPRTASGIEGWFSQALLGGAG